MDDALHGTRAKRGDWQSNKLIDRWTESLGTKRPVENLYSQVVADDAAF